MSVFFKATLIDRNEEPGNLNGLTNFFLTHVTARWDCSWLEGSPHMMIYGPRRFPSCGSAFSLGSSQSCSRSHFHLTSWRGNKHGEPLMDSGAHHCHSCCSGPSAVVQSPNRNGGWKCSYVWKPRRKRKQVWVISQQPLPQWSLDILSWLKMEVGRKRGWPAVCSLCHS